MKEWTKHLGEDGVLSDAGIICTPVSERDYYINAIKEFPIISTDMLK